MFMPTLEDLQSLSPTAFEQMVKRVFDHMGYEATVTGRSGDEGVDLVLEKGDERSIAQCKRYKGQVGQRIIREFYGAVVHEKAERGYLVTTGTFSLPAQTWAQGKNLILVDGADLVKSIDALSLQVAMPSPTVREPKQLTHLGDELRSARQQEIGEPLRLAILGPPPTSDGYRSVAKAIAEVLGRKPVYLDPTETAVDCYRTIIRRNREDLLFLDELEADSKKARVFIDAVNSGILFGLTVPKSWAPSKDEFGLPFGDHPPSGLWNVDVACAVWEQRKMGRLPSSVQMKFTECFQVQIDADSIDWADAEGWVHKMVGMPPATEEQPS